MKVLGQASVRLGWSCSKDRKWLVVVEKKPRRLATALLTRTQAMKLAARLQRWALKLDEKRRRQRAAKRITKRK